MPGSPTVAAASTGVRRLAGSWSRSGSATRPSQAGARRAAAPHLPGRLLAQSLRVARAQGPLHGRRPGLRPGAVLSHRSAADLHGLRRRTAPRASTSRSRRRGHAPRRHRHPPLDHPHRRRHHHRRRHPRARPSPAPLLDLADVVRRRAVERALDQAEHARGLRPPRPRRPAAAQPHATAAPERLSAGAGRATPPGRPPPEQTSRSCPRAHPRRRLRLPEPERQVRSTPATASPRSAPTSSGASSGSIVEADGVGTTAPASAFEADRRRDQRLIARRLARGARHLASAPARSPDRIDGTPAARPAAHGRQ